MKFAVSSPRNPVEQSLADGDIGKHANAHVSALRLDNLRYRQGDKGTFQQKITGFRIAGISL